MFKRLYHIILMLCTALFVFTSCKDKYDAPQIESVNNRTVLVYMLADNNLGYFYDYDKSNIATMCQSFADKDINGRLLVFHAGSNMQPCLKEIYKTDTEQMCKVKVLKNYPNAISTDSTTIQQVLNDVKSLAPSSNYGLVLWSHATGWLPQNRLYTRGRQYATTSFGREGEHERTINIDILARSLRDTHFDFILFDACLMGNVETAYELRNVCDYIIATPTETVGEGFPYYDITPLLFNKEIDYTSICQHYFDQVSSDAMGGTVTLISTRALEQLAEACHKIVSEKADEIKSLNPLRIQHYDRTSTHIFYDLGHYMQAIGDSELYPSVEEALSQAVVYKANTNSFINIKISHYSGISCYIPYSSNDDVIEEYYQQLQWYKRVYDTH